MEKTANLVEKCHRPGPWSTGIRLEEQVDKILISKVIFCFYFHHSTDKKTWTFARFFHSSPECGMNNFQNNFSLSAFYGAPRREIPRLRRSPGINIQGIWTIALRRCLPQKNIFSLLSIWELIWPEEKKDEGDKEEDTTATEQHYTLACGMARLLILCTCQGVE